MAGNNTYDHIPGLNLSGSLPVLGHILFVGSKRIPPYQLPTDNKARIPNNGPVSIIDLKKKAPTVVEIF